MNKHTCTGCGVEKPRTSEFFYKKTPASKLSKHDDGFNTRCKSCIITKVTRWNQANKSKVYAKDKRIRQSNSDWLNSLKDKPCADCKNTFPVICMDFDHLPEFEKTIDLSLAKNRKWSKEKLLTEVSKCEVVCSNCHRIRTENRRLVFANSLREDIDLKAELDAKILSTPDSFIGAQDE